MINKTISDIFEFLQVHYGRITEEELVQEEEDIQYYDYNPHASVDKVSTQVMLFQDLCAIMNNDKMDK